MKYLFLLCLFFGPKAESQSIMAEFMLGTSSYNGDLTQSAVAANRLGGCGTLQVRYQSKDYWSIRAGLSYGRISGADRKNKDEGLQSRNLSFKSNIIEFSVCGELAVVDPQLYFSYPYIFGGLGLMHFNPYAFDNENKKTFLRPLSTEGQGLIAYPDRKKYSLYQICIPFGLGWKVKLKNQWEVSYEFGYRVVFTDYLDDVSTTYVSLKNLSELVSQKSAEMSYRKQAPFQEEGEARGNSKVKDMYFLTGIKLAVPLSKQKPVKQVEND